MTMQGRTKKINKDGSLGVRGELLARSIEIGRGTATTHTVDGSFNSKPVRFGLNTIRAEHLACCGVLTEGDDFRSPVPASRYLGDRKFG